MPIDLLGGFDLALFNDTDGAVQNIISFIEAAVSEVHAEEFRVVFGMLKPVANSIGADNQRYEHASPFGRGDGERFVTVFAKMKEDGAAFMGRWGFAADPGERPSSGTISFELERDYIEFKMRIE